jgi:hypothetical protein
MGTCVPSDCAMLPSLSFVTNRHSARIAFTIKATQGNRSENGNTACRWTQIGHGDNICMYLHVSACIGLPLAQPVSFAYAGVFLNLLFTLRIEAISYSETSVEFHWTTCVTSNRTFRGLKRGLLSLSLSLSKGSSPLQDSFTGNTRMTA